MLKHLIPAMLLAATPVVLPASASPAPKKAHAEEGHAPSTSGSHSADHAWTYSGPSGPDHWGEKDPSHAACRVGAQQSPVDLTAPISAFASSPQIDWSRVNGGEIVNNGHTLQMNVEKAGGIVRNGKLFKLIQFHFHTPSEHTIDGHHFPMEAHFVHQASDGSLAVIGVMFTEGANNATLDPIWWAAPGMPGKAAVSFAFDPEDLLPTNRASMWYEGSLTTPPCSEIVDWTVMTTPLTASKAQITVFRSLFGENARPTQPLNRRFILATPH